MISIIFADFTLWLSGAIRKAKDQVWALRGLYARGLPKRLPKVTQLCLTLKVRVTQESILWCVCCVHVELSKHKQNAEYKPISVFYCSKMKTKEAVRAALLSRGIEQREVLGLPWSCTRKKELEQRGVLGLPWSCTRKKEVEE